MSLTKGLYNVFYLETAVLSKILHHIIETDAEVLAQDLCQ